MAKHKRGLGRGLAALIPDDPVETENHTSEGGDHIEKIDITRIQPNSEQPRKEFDIDALEELSSSIKEYGVLQPIIVRKKDNGYELIAGERRWRAAKDAGLKNVPCLVKDVEQNKSTEMALVENIQREDLNAVEEAFAYRNLMTDYGLTQDEVASIIGKSRSYIANTIRLLNLNEGVLNLISQDIISAGHGRALLTLESQEVQLKVAQKIVDEDLSVRETEKLVKSLMKEKTSKTKAPKIKDPAIIDIEEQLRKVLGTKVEINRGQKKGKIEIEYYNDEDLERILEILSV